MSSRIDPQNPITRLRLAPVWRQAIELVCSHTGEDASRLVSRLLAQEVGDLGIEETLRAELESQAERPIAAPVRTILRRGGLETTIPIHGSQHRWEIRRQNVGVEPGVVYNYRYGALLPPDLSTRLYESIQELFGIAFPGDTRQRFAFGLRGQTPIPESFPYLELDSLSISVDNLPTGYIQNVAFRGVSQAGLTLRGPNFSARLSDELTVKRFHTTLENLVIDASFGGRELSAVVESFSQGDNPRDL